MWIFDGGTLGGTLGPGSDVAINQVDVNNVYYGTVPAEDLITGTALATMLNFTAGIEHANTEWFKFGLDGKIIYLPRRPLRHSLDWSQIAAANLVYGQRTVTIGGNRFIVRLIKGDTVDPTPRKDYTSSAHWNDESEWGRTLTRLAAPAYGGNGIWGNYNAVDLDVTSGTAGSTWAQETASADPTKHVVRGSSSAGVAFFATRGDGLTAMLLYRSWRPVLELVG